MQQEQAGVFELLLDAVMSNKDQREQLEASVVPVVSPVISALPSEGYPLLTSFSFAYTCTYRKTQ